MEAAEGFAGIRSTRNANSDGLEPVPIVRTVVLEKFGPLVFRDKRPSTFCHSVISAIDTRCSRLSELRLFYLLARPARAVGVVAVVANEMFVLVGEVIHELTVSRFNAGMSAQLRSNVAFSLQR